MLVILTDEQILSPRQVCQSCLLASHEGSPRWHHGKLDCGHALRQPGNNHLTVYECQMGFKIANIE